jgi:tRNA pseudouridine55 synthase
MDGYILLNKPSGVTSFEALEPVKRILGTQKVGHTGTLDKFADGLMVLLTGEALKQQEAFTHLDKKYTATVYFGRETATLDPEGVLTAEAIAPEESAILQSMEMFLGEIKQTPPVYSAIRINGSRASDLARRGRPPVMRPRSVIIYEMELLSYDKPMARLAVHCSSGTYIRALARDIALTCRSRAYLTSLTRTMVGEYHLEDAMSVDDTTTKVVVHPIKKKGRWQKLSW